MSVTVEDANVFYLLFAGTLVFFMQAGFAMLCAGSVRQKNVKNIMLKNILDACGGALGFFLVGYMFAQGDKDDTSNRFIGLDGKWFFLKGVEDGGDYMLWFFHFTFAATAATIVAGTVAERCKMVAYLCYSFMLTAFVYPVVNHSIWGARGFLSAFHSGEEGKLFESGMIDFAGSGVVHMTGGATALIAAIILGPRIGRFYDKDGNALPEPGTFAPHSVALQVLGTFILWVGWYGFNPGSTLGIGYGKVGGLCAVTTTLSAAAGCMSSLFTDTILGYTKTGEFEYDLSFAMNGALSGLVGITAGCSVVAPWAAMVIGIVAGWVYVFSSNLLVKLKIDDAVDAIPVHFFNGMWGCIAVGLFAEPNRTLEAYGSTHAGWFYSWGMKSGDAHLLLIQFTGVVWIGTWVSGTMIPFFIALNTFGLFRVDPLEEEVGLDISHHRGAAYDMQGPSKEDVDELVARRATAHGKVEVPEEVADTMKEVESEA